MPTIDFKGKHFIYGRHLTVPVHNLDIDEEKSPSDSPSPDDNLIIHGDNLFALKALLPRYAGRIKCIYIDPPYNTGKGDWIYKDNVDSPLTRVWLKDNTPISIEDLECHDKWLGIMWSRLHLLRELLSEDGAIFISINDNEVHRLRVVMDEIFKEKNFVESFIWKKKGAAGNTVKHVGDITEYVLMYARDITQLSTNRRIIENPKYPYKDEKGSYKLEGLLKQMKGCIRGIL